jgi:signal transduction histidine kinase
MGLRGNRDVAQAVLAFGALILVTLWLCVAYDLVRERERALAAVESETGNLARALSEHMARTVSGLDQVLLFLKRDYERDPARFDLSSHLARASALDSVSLQLAVIGADGQLLHSSLADAPKMDLSDREHFRVHAASAEVGLYISKPVLGRASGRWSIQLTRRLDGPGGRFAGVAVLSLDPEYLSRLYEAIDLGRNGSILLLGRDGVVRGASDRGGADMLGRVLDDQRLAAGGPAHLSGPFDFVDRVGTFRQVPGQPLSLWVGRSREEALAPLRDAAMLDVSVGLVISACLAVGVFLLHGLARRQQAIADDLRASRVQLLASRERMARYAADLERIADVAAHDLQEPLRRVVAYTQLLAHEMEGKLAGDADEYVRHIVEGARRMRALVRDLEAFVALDALPLADQPSPAQAAANEALRMLSGELTATGGTVTIGLLPSVVMDARALTEIFFQLLDNAVRHRTEERKPLIHVSGRLEDGVAVLSVRDNGTGIEPQYFNRIFELFHRLHGADAELGGAQGTGIGLAIARRLVERHGGRIWVESVPGEGSSFHFTVPLAATQREPGEDAKVAA